MVLNGFYDFLETSYFGNTGEAYLIFLAIFFGLLIFFKLLQVFVIHKVHKKVRNLGKDNYFLDMLDSLNWPFYTFLSLYLSLEFLVLSEMADKVLRVILLVVIIYYAVKLFNALVTSVNKTIVNKRIASGDMDTAVVDLLAKIVKGVTWLVGILVLLSNMGVEITPLIAGLGIGGLAIAIALQGVLSDLFASFAIYFDKPFRAGDFIIIGSDMGVVQDIGIKSTRIKTLHGQELIVSNQELTSTRINNYRKLEKRRVVFHFGVEYSTPVSKVKKIPGIVKKIVDKVKLAEFDRAHFQKFGDFSLDFEVVYFVNVNDFAKYMDTQQEINVKLMEAFEKEKIVFAFPTQTLHIASHKKE